MSWVLGFDQGNGSGRDLLGGKGANLAEMTLLELPVPPGFTITTEACRAFLANDDTLPDGLWEQVLDGVKQIETRMGRELGGRDNPLLVSVRSGAKFSMPGMMDTILNLGLNDESVEGLATVADARFAWDCYRRLIQMYAKVVLNVNSDQFEDALDALKRRDGVTLDYELPAESLRELVAQFKQIVERDAGQPFPTDPYDQLRGSITAVFSSWNNRRAIAYRNQNHIPHDLGTAVNVQSMVFGNLGPDSATGVAFTRNPSTGETGIFGEFLVNAQGEDVVAGVRTPLPMAEMGKLPEFRQAYAEFNEIASRLERHYRDMQDVEFTIQNGRLFMLQTRTGKRTGQAAVNVAVDMVGEGLISETEAVQRVEPAQLDQLLHPMIDPAHTPDVIAVGLPASPGAATGAIVYDADEAKLRGDAGEKVILVRVETSPEDFHGMVSAQAVLTARGGMTCVAGESRILTDRGLIAAESAFALLDIGATLRILSLDSDSLQPVWRPVVAAGRKPSEVITVAVSQTGRAKGNLLRLTPDHKMLTICNRKLTKKRVDAVLADGDFATVVDRVPASGEPAASPSLAYLAGAIFSDGYVRLTPTKGYVTFVQKPTPEKAAFIAGVERRFAEVFDTPLAYVRHRETVGELQGRTIRGSVEDRISIRREPAARLTDIRANLGSWVLSLNQQGLLSFLAGFVDGDGTFAEVSSAIRLQVIVSRAKPDLLEAVALACLRLGIVPQITHNRDAYCVQIAERVDQILDHTLRVNATIRPRYYSSKCLSVRALFDDIVDEVNVHGHVRQGIKRNLMFGVESLRRNVLPLCPSASFGETLSLLNSSLRSHRLTQVGGAEPAMVYNFEVAAECELDKNFVVFTSRLTPIVVSNSHAAVVARGMGKPCVVGCGALEIDYASGTIRVDRRTLKKGDFITIDGASGRVMLGDVPTIEPNVGGSVATLLGWADQRRRLGVRANADTPNDAAVAREFGAEGIGLCRTEHMFFEGDRILAMREMILASSAAERRTALDKLLPIQQSDFAGIFRAMDGLPVTIRTLDPPLHEFLPHTDQEIQALAQELGVSAESIRNKVDALHESNPMLGHRGCRLGISYPEITEMQARAIFQAAVECARDGVTVIPEIMIPLVADVKELERQRAVVDRVAREVLDASGQQVDYSVGTMIELPRAALTADQIARHADFFSFGTNDLTQTTFGLSRDDAGRFLPFYVEEGILERDPFVTLDESGVGQLIEMAAERGRSTRPDIKLGICGEHGGDPDSVTFCDRAGLDYVSCSPFRVPVARLAAAQAALGATERDK